MGRAAADSSVFHAIADPTRRAILDLLREGEMSVTALMERVSAGDGRAGVSGAGSRATGRGSPRGSRGRTGATPPPSRRGRHAALSQSAFSQHLAVLRRAGLVASRKSGRARIYAVRPQPLREVVDWIAFYERFWTERLENLARYLDQTHGGAGEGPSSERPR